MTSTTEKPEWSRAGGSRVTGVRSLVAVESRVIGLGLIEKEHLSTGPKEEE